MNRTQLTDKAWLLVSSASSACKPLLWLRDSDCCLPLAPEILLYLCQALGTVVQLPNAVDALCDKMTSVYEQALNKNWVGISAQPKTSRLGCRTAKIGLLRARNYARQEQERFRTKVNSVKHQWKLGNEEWKLLFALTKEFIDCLDWGEFVVRNARGQTANLVLESIELLEAIEMGKSEQVIKEEIGDVFYNLIACCLSLRIEVEDILL